MAERTEEHDLTWSGRAILSPAIIAIVVALQAGTYVGLSRDGLTLVGILITLPLLLVLLIFLWVRVEVTTEGVHARLGLLGYPRFFRSIDEIVSAELLRVRPLRFGGWGYRWISGGYAIILRRGDAVDLTMRAGRRFLVTVDGASDGVAHINGLLAAAKSQGGRSYLV